MNLCGAEEKNRIFARETMADDLARLEHVPGQYYNFHPGSHVGQGSETGIALIADGLNAILRPNQATTVLLETMAGKGSEVGGRFEELRAILDRVELSGKVGVCLDTCHVSDGGYDIVHDLDGVLTEFDSIIGLRRLKAIHLNDSKNPPGSRKDRHACLGAGDHRSGGAGADRPPPALKDLPFCLETPNDLPGLCPGDRPDRGRWRRRDGIGGCCHGVSCGRPEPFRRDLPRLCPAGLAGSVQSGADPRRAVKTMNFTAWDGGQLAGCLRVLTDGCFFGTITELLVLPAYQRQGIGSRLLRLAAAHSPHAAVFRAQPGAEAF